jgi:hypothetical protein
MQKDVVGRTESWFVREGVPHLIAGYGFRSHVLPRMLPFLAAVIVVSLSLTVLLAGLGAGSVVLAGASVVLIALLGLPWLLARMGRQLPRLSRKGATAVLIAFAATPIVLSLLLVATNSQAEGTLVLGSPGASTPEVAVGAGLVLAATFAAIFVTAWFVTAYGLIALARRAVWHALTDMRSSLQMQGRALPTLLFVTFFLFFTGELWQLMNHLAWGRLVLVLALFAAVTVLATSTRLRAEIDRVEQDLSPQRLTAACAATPLADLADRTTAPPPPALTARQETNLLLVLATRQLIQAAVVGLGLFVFFIVLGLIIVDSATAALWIGAEPQRSAWIPLMPVALPRAVALLAGFGSMYFAITAMTQESYRREFFEPVIEDVERTLAVRAVYLGLRETGQSRPATTTRRCRDDGSLAGRDLVVSGLDRRRRAGRRAPAQHWCSNDDHCGQ